MLQVGGLIPVWTITLKAMANAGSALERTATWLLQSRRAAFCSRAFRRCIAVGVAPRRAGFCCAPCGLALAGLAPLTGAARCVRTPPQAGAPVCEVTEAASELARRQRRQTPMEEVPRGFTRIAEIARSCMIGTSRLDAYLQKR